METEEKETKKEVVEKKVYEDGKHEYASKSVAGSTSSSPTPFQAWEKACDDAIQLTNTIWGLKMNTQQQMYAHRDTDINEKFQLYKSQIDDERTGCRRCNNRRITATWHYKKGGSDKAFCRFPTCMKSW